MEEMCRLCGLMKSPTHLVSSIDDEVLNIRQKLLTCCRWETIGCDNVNLPRKICNICMKVLEKSWIFAERVAQTQAQLNTHVVEIKTEIFISDGMDEVLDNDEQSMDYNEFNAYLPSDYERYYPHQKEIDEYLESLERKLHEPLHMKTGKKVRTEKLTEHLCETCGRHFSNKNNLLTHTHMHLMPTDRRKYFQCYICKATFSYKKSLLYHMPAHCGKPTKYRCNVCRLPFSRLDSLNRHKLIHSQTNPHECHICGKAFRTKYILKTHERTHTGDRPFPCKYCHFRSSTRSNVKRHIRSIHRDIYEIK